VPVGIVMVELGVLVVLVPGVETAEADCVEEIAVDVEIARDDVLVDCIFNVELVGDGRLY
jgi:hypothetical protein